MFELPTERGADPKLSDTIALVVHRQDKLAEKVDAVEAQVTRTCVNVEEINAKLDAQGDWQREHDHTASKLLELREDIVDLVAAAKWLRISRNVIAIVGGAIIGLLLFYDTVMHGIENFRGP